MKNKTIFSALTILFIASASVQAHDVFKDPFIKRYGLKSASCKVCHPVNKDKTIQNKLGKYYEEALKGSEITKKFNEATEQGEEAQKAYEKEMVKLFEKAMVVVEKKSMTFADLTKAGLLAGTKMPKPPEKKEEAAKEATKETEPKK